MYGGNSFPVFPLSRGFSSEPVSQTSGMSRPSAKSIYMQRKEYAESMSRQQDDFQYRLEHLFTCEFDGREVSNIEDCVTRLKSLDSKGKVWGQDMIMGLQGNNLQLCDIETKEVLESINLNSIKKAISVLDSCVYDSLLIIVVQDYSQRSPQAFLFQCEESGAQDVLNDLNRAIPQGGGDISPPLKEPQLDIRSNLENILGRGFPGSFKRPTISPQPSTPPPPEYPPPQFNHYQDYDDREPSPIALTPRDERHEREPTPPPYDMERNAEIFNHVAADIEIFINKCEVALPKKDVSKKKKKEKKSKTKAVNVPPVDEYVSFLQKIKYGFNLLGKLDGYLQNPPASDFVHSIFSSLGFVVNQYPPNIPTTVLSPMLTEKALLLLGVVVTSEEDRLWASLGDSWSIPRSKWPNGDQIPPYYPVFYDGWQTPPPTQSLTPPPRSQLSQQNGEQFPPRNVSQRPPEQDDIPWSAPPIRRSAEPPLYMRVNYDFMARNSRELNLVKGEMVEVIDKSGQWWKVKKSRGEEGHVPNNVLEPADRDAPTANHGRGGAAPIYSQQNMRGPPPLDMKSRPEEVRAWLQYKGFSKGTVQSLGVFDGAMLLGMKQYDIRAICPEEGSRVFFQLQSVRSSIALASEAEYPYGPR
ncbi:epidermal growth factor receptor kinase substrate 8-like protein 3b isoform X1 [Triplophysa dalaica]|uniref:epidermal growth factor receptor kinase substrate 8-like protein 3b isoform X1 n=1 Tax=Triplophysa dalaica TaxID=1582913 RepID=UPI0024E0020F|nr:epidermal growth factor receptor kinase substrate 8-like protein 3b isoform X1 [Triplophysa dalaica]